MFTGELLTYGLIGLFVITGELGTGLTGELFTGEYGLTGLVVPIGVIGLTVTGVFGAVVSFCFVVGSVVTNFFQIMVSHFVSGQ